MKIKRKIHQSEMASINNQIHIVEGYMKYLRDLLKERKLNEIEINNTLAAAGYTLNSLAHETMTAVRSVGKEME